jgi:hypothetical protein
MKRLISFMTVAPAIGIMLGACMAACNDARPNESTSSTGTGGDAGATGNGNAGGNGGTGGAGGASIPACSTAEAMVAADGWPWVGLEQMPMPTPDFANGAPATVSSIDVGGLILTFPGAAPDARLAWEGAELNQVFAKDDMVTVTMDAVLQAYRVTAAKGQAVVLRYANANVPATLPAIPGGGPALALEVECAFEQLKMCPLPERRTLYSLSASLGPDSAKIPSGMNAQVGTWQVHHVKTMNIELYSAGDCLPDHIFDGIVQALEVKP